MKNREKKPRKKKYNKAFFIVIYLLAVLALYLIIYIVPKITGLLDSTYIAKYGQLQIEDQVNGYFIRDEVVYLSKSGGKVKKLATEGELIRGGTQVVEVSGTGEPLSDEEKDALKELGKRKVETDDYTVNEGGIVSYFFDGQEGNLTPKSISKIKKEQLDKIKEENVKELGNSNAKKGEPVFKIIDKSKWYLLAYIPKEHKDRYKVDKSVEVVIGDDEDNPITCSVVDMKKNGDTIQLLMETSGFIKDIGKRRVGRISIITGDYKGIILDEGSIVKKGNKAGVYIRNKQGKYDFVPVDQYGSAKGKVVVADGYFHDEKGNRIATVKPFDDVLKNPK